MNIQYNPKLKKNSQKLRKAMTKEERHLWYDFFKQLPQIVRRQKIFGKYIVDFYIESAKIVVELDGSQHYETSGQISDSHRDSYLCGLGLTVLRYSNADIHCRFERVCEDILHHMDAANSP